MSPADAAPTAKVYFVGAGPGDPELLTLRGAQCLRRADVVLYDYLVNPRVLRHARAGVELHCLGRHGRGGLWTQEEINARMLAAAAAGRIVVRLKSGDPTIFARLAEELTVLDEAGIPYEIVPGVTAALAAGSYAGIPLTQRDDASAVAFVTGRESAKQIGPVLDYAALAYFPGTLVFYMGITTAAEWSAALLAAGKSPATPVAIVRRVSWYDQETLDTTLGEVAEFVAARHLRPPAIVIVGEVAAARRWREWFQERPLFGRTVLVSRPAGQTDDLAEQLTELGAQVLLQPAIEISPPVTWDAVDAVLGRLQEFDWVAFSSANGVRMFFERLLAVRGDVRQLGHCKLAAIGPGTALELHHYGLRADVMPEEYRAEGLAEAIAPLAKGQRVLLIRASRGREVLSEMLKAAGCHVEQVVVYRSTDVSQPEHEVLEALRAGRISWITVTSSAIGRSLISLFGDDLRRTQLASISSLTSSVCAAAGFPPLVEAAEATMTSLVAAILQAESGQANAVG